MVEMVVLVPTRGRPHAAAELTRAYLETTNADTQLIFVIDDDDPTKDQYFAEPDLQTYGIGILTQAGGNLVAALNNAAEVVLGQLQPYAVANLGDDHRPRTYGWDEKYLDALHQLGTGIVYGDDLFQRSSLPTQVAMTADIPRTLGHMGWPALHHLYVDNYWLELGRTAGCLRYLPDVVVEHLHPHAGKAPWDDGYARVNSDQSYQHNALEYRRWYSHHREEEADKIRRLAHG